MCDILILKIINAHRKLLIDQAVCTHIQADHIMGEHPYYMFISDVEYVVILENKKASRKLESF